MVREPNATTEVHVEELRAIGYDDRQIFAITVFVALRIAFSMVNDTLGAAPDPELLALARSRPGPRGRRLRPSGQRPDALVIQPQRRVATPTGRTAHRFRCRT